MRRIGRTTARNLQEGRTAAALALPLPLQLQLPLLLPLLLLLLTGTPAKADEATTFAVAEQFDAQAERSLWPGFDPRTVPLAIYDGEATYLFRHGSPPEGFEPVAGRYRVHRRSGRHGVTSNSHGELGGVMTATVMANVPDRSPQETAAVAVHEAFHVHQLEHFPAWAPNEFDLLVYPFDDAGVLALRRLETLALRRALEARTEPRTACWAARVREIRRQRFRELPPAASAYEQAAEHKEGLARYVQGRAQGQAPETDVEFLPEEVRDRTYWSGQALATILDRLEPAWKTRLTEDDDQSLQSLLANALAQRQAASRSEGQGTCAFSEEERLAVEEEAQAAVTELQDRRQQKRAELLGADGWTLVVESPDGPLWPQGFDPLNVLVLDRGEVIHSRYLEAGNDGGSLEILGPAALTVAAGEHPLAQGFQRLLVPGLAEEPRLQAQGDGFKIESEGITGTFSPARSRKEGRSIVVRLGTTPFPQPDPEEKERRPGVEPPAELKPPESR